MSGKGRMFFRKAILFFNFVGTLSVFDYLSKKREVGGFDRNGRSHPYTPPSLPRVVPRVRPELDPRYCAAASAGGPEGRSIRTRILEPEYDCSTHPYTPPSLFPGNYHGVSRANIEAACCFLTGYCEPRTRPERTIGVCFNDSSSIPWYPSSDPIVGYLDGQTLLSVRDTARADNSELQPVRADSYEKLWIRELRFQHTHQELHRTSDPLASRPTNLRFQGLPAWSVSAFRDQKLGATNTQLAPVAGIISARVLKRPALLGQDQWHGAERPLQSVAERANSSHAGTFLV
ncbi:hypothetical protein V8F20_002960 [Naviculisporaceae sp. PSN 640]